MTLPEARTPEQRIERLREGMQSPSAVAEAERAPAPPPDAIELLRATGCPIVRRKNTGAAA